MQRTLDTTEAVAIGCALRAKISDDPSFFPYVLENSQELVIEGRLEDSEI